MPRALIASLLTVGVLGLAACGSGEDDAASAPTASPAAAPTTATSSKATDCPDVPVPGHLAEDVKATGLSCDDTVAIANTAEGLGRAAYESGGFACEPEDAAGGKTNYTCTKGEATLTFLYG